jgi:hypothetical protein
MTQSCRPGQIGEIGVSDQNRWSLELFRRWMDSTPLCLDSLGSSGLSTSRRDSLAELVDIL